MREKGCETEHLFHCQRRVFDFDQMGVLLLFFGGKG